MFRDWGKKTLHKSTILQESATGRSTLELPDYVYEVTFCGTLLQAFRLISAVANIPDLETPGQVVRPCKKGSWSSGVSFMYMQNCIQDPQPDRKKDSRQSFDAVRWRAISTMSWSARWHFAGYGHPGIDNRAEITRPTRFSCSCHTASAS